MPRLEGKATVATVARGVGGDSGLTSSEIREKRAREAMTVNVTVNGSVLGADLDDIIASSVVKAARRGALSQSVISE